MSPENENNGGPFFDDDGQPVNVVGFDYAALDPSPPEALPADDAIRLRQEVLGRMLTTLTTGKAGLEQIGRRTLIFAFLCGKLDCTQEQLARRLNLSPGRISQLLTEIENA